MDVHEDEVGAEYDEVVLETLDVSDSVSAHTQVPPVPAVVPPEPANPPAAEDTKESNTGGFFDRCVDRIEHFREQIRRMGEDPSKISFSSLATAYGKQALGYALVAVGWLWENPLWFVFGGALVIAGIWFFSAAKTRRDARVAQTK